MKRRGLILAVVLILAVNGFVMAGVAFNRSGQPEAEITLSERELHVPYRFKSRDENSGLSLQIVRNSNGQTWEWFGKDKLEELGFDLRGFEKEADEDNFYRKTILPRKAFAVLELDGEVRSRYLEEKRKKLERAERNLRLGRGDIDGVNFARREYETAMTIESRLFIVDVGGDPAVLRGKYPDRSSYPILPAEVRAYVRDWDREGSNGDGRPRIIGRVSKLLPGSVNVPGKFHKVLYDGENTSAKKSNQFPAKLTFSPFEAVLKIGKRHEVWIEEIRGLEKN